MSDLINIPDGLVSKTDVFRGEVTLNVTRENVIALLTHLRDEQKFDMLTDETCVDYHPREPRFGILYQLYSVSRNTRVRVKMMLSEHDAVAPSATGLWKNANWMEREVYDLFGIHYEGHPDMRRILLPNDYVGHPLRKEIPVAVEENQFSFNRERVDAGKIYVTE
ncbi:MAG TPA: NADH-quinone oxidoreductase subunit C [Thermoflexales bacterium]|nr:NADH-quinone oxidoreductase subunit C [Thermoflexales bacterium]HQW36771.1 NADH-quinone oxidoreductase subunit C [Thermoflexales bacterium]HQZ23551.1 NADH-quinone oxidoreductase subunit C [Thermoflexales bacterium]HRA00737.1 NADH-quinone oxidoreductase subunit C [Thermoflexales bacterium]